jgi:hypothetical protein
VLLAQPAPVSADVGLILQKAVVRQGDPMTVRGGCRMPIYLVPDSYARRTGLYAFSFPVARPPMEPPFRRLGRTRCTGRLHYLGDFPDGDWSSWSGYLRFRVPLLRPGRYHFVVYCAPCRRGPGGSIVVSNHLWRSGKRIGLTALTILPAAKPRS